jgi:predicted dehydrogenase
MAKKLKALMVGCGGMSWAWLDSASKIAEIEIAGLVDPRLEAAEFRRQQFRLEAPVGRDLKSMLKALKPDLVFDCSVHMAHASVTTAALNAGAHVLGEKPLAHSMQAARRVVELARKRRRLYAVLQNRRYDPQIRAFRRFLASGKIGQLHTLYTDFFMTLFVGGYRKQLMHPLLLDMAIHTFDAARYISGQDAKTVYCKEFNPPGSSYRAGASAIAVFEMGGGMVHEYRGSWCPIGLNTTWESRWHALGTRGSATWDGAKAYDAEVGLGALRRGMKTKHLLVPKPLKSDKSGGHYGVMREFVDCVLYGGKPETLASDNIKSLAMVFAAIKSAETGKKVKVSW